MVKRLNGLVFVSYAHEDLERVAPLVNFLAPRFNVYWDRKIEPGQVWREKLMVHLDSARCVIVVWTTESVTHKFIWSELERVKDRGVVVPVKLDKNAKIPVGLDDWQYVDLIGWNGETAKPLKTLMDRVSRLLRRGHHVPRSWTTLAKDTNIIPDSVRATKELVELSDKIESIGAPLAPGDGPVRYLVRTLEEINKTYSSVSDAIGRFVAPAVSRGRIEAKRYLAMERGDLVTMIQNNRGHCSRILEYYIRVGGLRDSLEGKLSQNELSELDQTFDKLSTADGDMFAQLSRIGDVLTDEASEIVGLILSDQQKVVRKRILEGRQKLLPLQKDLRAAMTRLQEIESSLGYVSVGGRKANKRN
jgi:hypothetical protein